MNKNAEIENIIAELDEWHKKKGRAYFLLAGDLNTKIIYERLTGDKEMLSSMVARALEYKQNRQLLWRAWTFMLKQKLKTWFNFKNTVS